MLNLDEVYKQYKNGNLNYALKLVNEIISQNPELREAYSIKGRILMEMGKLDEALDSFMKANDSLGIAKVLIARGLYADALQYLEKGDSDEFKKLRALIYLRLEDFDKAFNEVKEITRDDDPLIYKIKGISEFKLGRFLDAIRDLSRAIEYYPVDAELYLFRALSLKELGDYKEAENDLQIAINLNPYYAEVYFNLGELKERSGSLQDAVTLYSKAIALNPNYRGAYVRRAKSYMKLGMEEEAMDDIKRVRELDGS